VITGRHENICKAAQISTSTLDAHSGKQENLTMKLGTPCAKKAAKNAGRHTQKKASLHAG